jgi:hypothetical protein
VLLGRLFIDGLLLRRRLVGRFGVTREKAHGVMCLVCDCFAMGDAVDVGDGGGW